MAHQTHHIPWSVLASNLEFLQRNVPRRYTANLYPRYKTDQGKEITYFIEAFVRALNDNASREREKYSEIYVPPDSQDIILSENVVRKISPTVHRYMLKHNSGKTGASRRVDQIYEDKICRHSGDHCTCPVRYDERRMASFLHPLPVYSCSIVTESDEVPFFSLEILKTLLLYGEMDPVLRICSHPTIQDLEFWRNKKCPCGPLNTTWKQVCENALRAYICLNVLYCYPELWDAASGRSKSTDYRHTRCYQKMLRKCCRPMSISEVAAFPHRQFFGVADGQFSVPEKLNGPFANIRDEAQWLRLKHEEPKVKYPYGKLPIEDFLALEMVPPHMASASDIVHVRWVLGSMGLPLELVLQIMDSADYTCKRRLHVPHDPLHWDNRDELSKYLAYCWQLLLRSDMMAKASDHQIPWASVVSECIVDLWGSPRQEFEFMPRYKTKRMYKREGHFSAEGMSTADCGRITFM